MKMKRLLAAFLAFSMLFILPAYATDSSTHYTSVSGGNSHSIAVDKDGTVFTWGSNNQGQLGPTEESSVDEPEKVQGLSAKAVSAGYDFSVALGTDGYVYSWGLGINKVPQKTNLSNVIAIDAGQVDIVAIRADGTVWSWTFGGTPKQVAGLSRIVDVSAGGGFLMALTVDGSVYTWGTNQNGQLGNGTKASQTAPKKISLSNVVDISAGHSHALAVTADGTVYAWGSNEYGQLGNSNKNGSAIPVSVDGVSNIVSVSAGSGSSIAMTRDEDVYSWGYGEYGQLGDGDNAISHQSPISVRNVSGVISIQSGLYHNFAVTSIGILYAWGRNQYGQLGNGKNSNSNVPTRIMSGINTGSISYNYITTGATAWAVADISELYSLGITPPMFWSSYTKPITRAEFVTMLVSLYESHKNADISPSSTSQYVDLKNHNLETYLRKAIKLELISGTSGNTISPDKALTRQEAAKLLCTFISIMNRINISDHTQTLSFYKDADQIADWANPYVFYAHQKDIMNGYSDGRFVPTANLTREQSLSIMLRLIKRYDWN